MLLYRDRAILAENHRDQQVSREQGEIIQIHVQVYNEGGVGNAT